MSGISNILRFGVWIDQGFDSSRSIGSRWKEINPKRATATNNIATATGRLIERLESDIARSLLRPRPWDPLAHLLIEGNECVGEV